MDYVKQKLVQDVAELDRRLAGLEQQVQMLQAPDPAPDPAPTPAPDTKKRLFKKAG